MSNVSQWQAVLDRLTPEKRELAEILLAKRLVRTRPALGDASPGAERVSYPATQSQQQFFVLHHKSKVAYNMPFGFLVARDIDEDQLEDALDRVVGRHPALRTRFEVQGGNLRQIVERCAPIELEVERISEACFSSFDFFTRPFALDRAPLLRCKLFILPSPARNVLALDLHHIIADDWAVAILVEDLNALLLGEEPIPPGDHLGALAEWEQTKYLTSSRYRDDLAFWKRYLEHCQGKVRPDERRGGKGGNEQCVATVKWRGAEAKTIREFCVAERTTRFALMICALNVAIHQHTGAVDIVIGTLATLRDLGDFGRTVGCFVNDVLIRSRLEPGMALEDAWHRVRASVQEALARKACPFSHVLVAASPGGDAIHNVIYSETVEGSDDKTRPVTPWRNVEDKGSNNFDLFVACEDSRGDMTVSLFARADWISEPQLARLKNLFAAAVESLVTRSQISLSAIAAGTAGSD